MRPFSLEGKLSLLLAATAAAGAMLGALLGQLISSPYVAIPLAAAVILAFALWMGQRLSDPVTRLLRALEGAVASYRDSDFSISLSADRRDEFGDLARAHNHLGQVLREQRQHLVQRELLLDTVVQNTPVALVLVDMQQRVAYANLASRHLFNKGRSLIGLDFNLVLSTCPPQLSDALQGGEDALFSLELEGVEETFQERQRGFRLAGTLPQAEGWFDRTQIEQVLINLLKNAHESGGAAEVVEMEILQASAELRIEVRDRGSGMSEQVLANALLPFYSTKRSGTGLGLALAREIVEAHGGRIVLANREGGGLRVSLSLPARS